MAPVPGRRLNVSLYGCRNFAFISTRTSCRSAEIILKHSMRHIAVIVVFASLAVVAAGCADSRMAAKDAAANNGGIQQSNYQVGYGLSNDGPTTDLYTELKGSLQRAERPQAAGSVQQGTTTAGANGQQVADTAPSVVQPPGPAHVEPSTSVYGISSDGPTTDVYTALFGSRDH
jgi:hypothetical protein